VDGKRVNGENGERPIDPLKFSDYLRRRGSDTVQIEVQRNGERKTVDLQLQPVAVMETPLGSGSPLSAPSLGIAYEVFNSVESVVDGSPAARAGLKPGDQIEWVQIVPTEAGKDYEERYSIEPLEFDDDHLNWPFFAHSRLQLARGDSKVRIQPKGRDPVDLDIALAPDWHNPDRGLRMQPLQKTRTAKSFTDALLLGAGETWEQLTLIYRGLHAIGRGQVSAKSIHSPIGIANIAFQFAEGGWSTYLIFLTLLSANLAVINFLPIPILDGGHMVFLAYEGIRGKPPSERVMVGAMYAGLAFLLSVMLFAVMLDVGIIARD
jgi:regulator of sigma E protease